MLCAMAEPTENKHEEPEASKPTEKQDEEPEASEPPEKQDEEPEASEPTEKQDEEPEASEPRKRARTKSSASSGSVFRWLAAVALVIALGALGVSLWVLLRPPSTGSSAAPATTSPSGPSGQQIAD